MAVSVFYRPHAVVRRNVLHRAPGVGAGGTEVYFSTDTAVPLVNAVGKRGGKGDPRVLTDCPVPVGLVGGFPFESPIPNHQGIGIDEETLISRLGKVDGSAVIGILNINIEERLVV